MIEELLSKLICWMLPLKKLNIRLKELKDYGLMKVTKIPIFFTKKCTARRRRNRISEIYDTQNINHNTNEGIQKAFVDHFNSIYATKLQIICLIDNLECKPIDNISSKLLIAPFNEEDIKNSIFFFECNKASDPDCFTLDFLKQFWNISKTDLLEVF